MKTKNGFTTAVIVAVVVFVIGASMVAYSLIKSEPQTAFLESGEQVTVSAEPIPDRPGDETTNWKSVKTMSLQFKVPPNWGEEKSILGEGQIETILLKSDENQTLSISIVNVSIDKMSAAIRTNFKVTKEERFALMAHESRRFEYSVTNGQTKTPSVTNVIEVIIKPAQENRVVSVIFSANGNMSDKTFRQILDTFKFS